MIRVPTTREREARFGQLVQRIWEWFFLKSATSSDCKLGREQRSRRSEKCSACTFNIDLKQLDRAIGQLIEDKIIVRPAHCPYVIFARALFIALVAGRGAQQSSKESERVRITELKTALRHIDRALETLSPRREEIKYFGEVRRRAIRSFD